MSSSSKKRPTNKGSLILTERENDSLFRLLGNNNYTLCSGVVQLLVADQRTQWDKQMVGVVCFVKDYAIKCYFLRIYDIEGARKIWEQQIYEDFETRKPHENLLTFEGDKYRVGLNFADTREAQVFKDALDRKRDQDEKTRQRMATGPSKGHSAGGRDSGSAMHGGGGGHDMAHSGFTQSPASQMNGVVANTKPLPPTEASVFGNIGGKKSKKGKKKQGIRKEDISCPTDFVHKVHIGWNPATGVEESVANSEDIDPEIQTFMDQIGIGAMKKEERQFAYDFINQRGGMEKLKEEIKTNPPPARPPPMNRKGTQAPGLPPATPNRTPTSYGHSQGGDKPPPPPPPRTDAYNSGGTISGRNQSVFPDRNQRQNMGGQSYQQQQSAMPNPPQRPLPPPPPMSVGKPAPGTGPGGRPLAGPPPPPPTQSHASTPPTGRGAPVAPPPPPPMSTPAPPPPPPPLAGGSAPPPPPPMPGSGGSRGGGDRSNLLAQIERGTALKHVEPRPTSDCSEGDGRDALLGAIRGGVQLKHVDQDENRLNSLDNIGGIAGALARALAERRQRIESDDSSDEDEPEDDDDDWDED